MNELDLLVENYFTDSFEASDLFRLVEQVMNEDEGQTGTAFEDVIVDLAKNGIIDAEYDKKGKVIALYNPKGNKPFKVESFAFLAIRCLRRMKYSIEQIKAGVDKEARKASGAGVSGDPKTDVVIDGKNISLKLPGDIQFSSGAATSTISAMETAYKEWLELPRTKEKLKVADNSLRDALDVFLPAIEATAGKIYYPHERGSRGKWRKYIGAWEDEFGKSTYEAMLAARAQGDWEADKYPSGGIPVDWKRVAGEEGKIVKVGPQQKFTKMRDYIDAFIALAKEKGHYKPEREEGEEPYESYEQFKNVALVDIKKEISELAFIDDDFYYILIDEWITGRRQFEGEQAADYLLSPWGFDDIRDGANTKKLAEKWKGNIGWDMRAKARMFLGKEMAVRIDFKADNFYKAARDKYLKRLPENLESNK